MIKLCFALPYSCHCEEPQRGDVAISRTAVLSFYASINIVYLRCTMLISISKHPASLQEIATSRKRSSQ